MTVPCDESSRPAPDPSGRGVQPDYRQLMELHNRNRIDYNDRKWETVKFFQAVFSALMVATVAAVIAALKEQLFDILPLRLLIAAMPLSAAVALWLGLANLRRESRLLFLEEYQLFKLARLVGLDTELQPEQRWLPDDSHLLLENWRNSTGRFDAKTVEKWVEGRLRHHRFLRLFRNLFWLEGLIGVLMTALVVGWPWLKGW